jgi:hypothetical protein
LPEAAWRKPWVAHCTSWGEGADAVLAYLARYVHRVAITNNRIIGVDDAGVAIRHKERESGRWLTMHLAGPEFMRLHKIRYYGLWHPSRRKDAARAPGCASSSIGRRPRPARPRPTTRRHRHRRHPPR